MLLSSYIHCCWVCAYPCSFSLAVNVPDGIWNVHTLLSLDEQCGSASHWLPESCPQPLRSIQMGVVKANRKHSNVIARAPSSYHVENFYSLCLVYAILGWSYSCPHLLGFISYLFCASLCFVFTWLFLLHAITMPSLTRLSATPLILSRLTSDSTGKPKGIMIEHWSITNLMQTRASMVSHKVSASCPHWPIPLIPLTYCQYVWNTRSWCNPCYRKEGACTWRYPQGPSHPPHQRLARESDTLYSLCGASWWIPLPWDYCYCRWGTWKETHWRLVRTCHVAQHVWSHWGFCWLCVLLCQFVDSSWYHWTSAELPYLHPRQATSSYPLGVEGELYVSGIQVARSYLNQEELTADAFIPNSFVPEERICESGDVALYCADGNIEYHGHADRQIQSFMVSVLNSERLKTLSPSTLLCGMEQSSFAQCKVPQWLSLSWGLKLKPRANWKIVKGRCHSIHSWSQCWNGIPYRRRGDWAHEHLQQDIEGPERHFWGCTRYIRCWAAFVNGSPSRWSYSQDLWCSHRFEPHLFEVSHHNNTQLLSP